MRARSRSLPVPEHWCCSANTRRKFDLHTGVLSDVDWIVLVLSPKIGRNIVDCVDDGVGRKCCTQMTADVRSESSILPTKKKRRKESGPTVSVNSDHCVDMLKKFSQEQRLIGTHMMRWNMPLQVRRLQDAIVGRSRKFCCSAGDDVGHFFKSTAVVRHETE